MKEELIKIILNLEDDRMIQIIYNFILGIYNKKGQTN